MKHEIGAVEFGKLHGEGTGFSRVSLMGDDRVKQLQRVRDGLELSEGMILFSTRGGHWQRITPDQINWETSNIKPTPRGNLADFIKGECIAMDCHKIVGRTDGNATEWDKSARHFRCTLIAGFGLPQPRKMTLEFSQGSAHTKNPTAADVLDCLASDASGYQNAVGFTGWAEDYGYDTDSRKAERIYFQIEAQAVQLRELLGLEPYERLLWNIERE